MNPQFTVQYADMSFRSRGKSLADSEFLSDLAKESKDGVKLRKALLFAWKNFAPLNGEFVYNGKCRIEKVILPPSDIVFLSFVYIAGYSNAGKDEKVAWSLAFTYKGVPFGFSLEKFGLRLYHHKDFTPAEGLLEEMLRSLGRAMKIIAKLCQPVIDQQVTSGNVTIANSFVELSNMYAYFREQASRNFAPLKPKPPDAKIDSIGAALTTAWRRRNHGNYNASAMIDTYFSRLEHLLIIILPFVDYDRTKHNLVNLMGAVWSDKFKAAFDLSKDTTARRVYERLIDLRERHRNPISHGNFKKDGKSLFFHFPHGAISCHLSESERSNSIIKFDATEFEAVCSLLDDVDSFFEKGPAEFGSQYAKAGWTLPLMITHSSGTKQRRRITRVWKNSSTTNPRSPACTSTWIGRNSS